MYLLEVRRSICYVLYSILGIALPALRTARAINERNSELMKEQLTYWTVLSILGMIELLCGLLRLYQNTAPEFRVMLILWLTQPEWGGSLQIYTLFIRPVFEVYEDDIDKSVEKYSGKFWTLVLRQLKKLAWHIAFAEEDGIVAGLMAFLGQAHRIPVILQFFVNPSSCGASMPPVNHKNNNSSSSLSSSSSTASLSKQKIFVASHYK